MSWKCGVFGHKFSQWLEDKENETQERWCKNCQFLERKSLKMWNCSKGVHDWTTWKDYSSISQRRKCNQCGKADRRWI